MQRAAKSTSEISRLIVSARRGEIICLTSIAVSLIAELYPTSPHYNIALGFFSLYLHNLATPTSQGRGQRWSRISSEFEQPTESFFILFIVITMISLFVDIDHLSSGQRPMKLEVSGVEINPSKRLAALFAALFFYFCADFLLPYFLPRSPPFLALTSFCLSLSLSLLQLCLHLTSRKSVTLQFP